MYVLATGVVGAGAAIVADALGLPSRLSTGGTVHHVLRWTIAVLLVAWAVAFAHAAIVVGRRRAAMLRHHPATVDGGEPTRE